MLKHRETSTQPLNGRKNILRIFTQIFLILPFAIICPFDIHLHETACICMKLFARTIEILPIRNITEKI